ncbi:MAG: tetratricopeptide repeat protein [Gammaproteobacteria bacterium]|nr:tetratricopeptide repeat protein [Gammaproteobacteria bacterium]
MADPHFTDDEQAQKLKEWWKQNGSSIIFGLVVGLGIVGGFNYWRGYTQTQAEQASEWYERMLTEYAAKQLDNAETAGAKLMADHSGTPYADKASLFLAKISHERNDTASAKAQLQWALDHASDEPTKHVARLRLGRLLLAEDAFADVEALLKVENAGRFASEYKELEGDLRVAQDRAAEARAAYQDALAALPAESAYRDMLSIKLDSVSGAVGQ